MILIKFYRYFKSNAKEVRVLEIVKSWLNIDDFRPIPPNVGRRSILRITWLFQDYMPHDGNKLSQI